ncbi:MAG: triose-phosphate isomerase [Armatimonadia bacterium]|nr:triose-phosphate isomerase [Armatimonadia bacterium]
MARNPFIAGNWKMNMTVPEGTELVSALIAEKDDISPVEVGVCPPFTALHAIGSLLKEKGSAIKLGGQDVFGDGTGAFTGMISIPMLTDCGCEYVILGHSERRGRFGTTPDWLTPSLQALFADNDETVNLKASIVMPSPLKPIICVGETIDERKTGDTDSIVRSQVEAALKGLDKSKLGEVVLAYEPVWAIGTGETCDSAEAQRVCKLIRDTVAGIDSSAAEAMRVQYGGSVKPDNAEELLGQPDIDGALVGGASLKADSFAAIVRAAKKTA